MVSLSGNPRNSPFYKIPTLDVDTDFLKLPCFVENEKMRKKKSDASLIFLRYLKEYDRIIEAAFQDSQTPIPTNYNTRTYHLANDLHEIQTDLFGRKKNGSISDLKERLGSLDSILSEISEKKITKMQQGIYNTNDMEEFKNYTDFDGEHLWAEFIPKFMVDLVRTTIILDPSQSCDLVYPFYNTNDGKAQGETRQDHEIITVALSASKTDIESYISSEAKIITDDMTNLKKFLKEVSKIINFMIDTFFDSQKMFEDKDCSIDPDNNEDLNFLAEFLVTKELPVELVGYTIKYKLSSSAQRMTPEAIEFRKFRGNLFLYVIKLMRLIQQLSITSIKSYCELIISHIEPYHYKNTGYVSVKLGEIIFIYDKKNNKISMVTEINIHFTINDSVASLPICYYTLQQSLDVSKELESRTPAYFDFLSNNDIFFKSLEEFLKRPSLDKIKDYLLRKKIKIDALSLNDASDSSSDSSLVSSSDITPEMYKEIFESLFNNNFLDRIFNLSELFNDKYYFVSEKNVEVFDTINASYPSTKYFDHSILKESETVFHSCLSYAYTNLPENHDTLSQAQITSHQEENFNKLIAALMEHLLKPETNKELDFVLVVNLESIHYFLGKFFDPTQTEQSKQGAYVISFVCNKSGSYTVYLGNNKYNIIPELPLAIANYSYFIDALNGKNLFMVITDASIEFTEDDRYKIKTSDNKVYNTLALLQRFSQSAPYVKSVIADSFLMKNMVTILVQNSQNMEDHNERINFFAKLLCIEFLNLVETYRSNRLHEFYKLCIIFGLLLIQNPKYFPKVGWEYYIEGEQEKPQATMVEKIEASFKKQKEELYKCLPSNYLFDEFKKRNETVFNRFVSERLANFINQSQQSAANRYSKRFRGGSRKTRKSSKYIKLPQYNKTKKTIEKNIKKNIKKTIKETIKKKIKKNNKNQSRKLNNITKKKRIKKIKVL